MGADFKMGSLGFWAWVYVLMEWGVGVEGKVWREG